jgi:hypothetical protein
LIIHGGTFVWLVDVSVVSERHAMVLAPGPSDHVRAQREIDRFGHQASLDAFQRA